MTAVVLLEHLRKCGYDLRLSGETLLVSPANQLSEQDRALIRANKPDLVLILQGRKPAPRTEQSVDLDAWVILRMDDPAHPEGREEAIRYGQLKEVVILNPAILDWPVRRHEGTAWIRVRDLGIRPDFLEERP